MTEHRRVVTASPENSETPLESVRSWVTPSRLFFVRNHFDVPAIDLSTWRLAVDGCVRNAFELSWDDITALPERTVFATVECAGNGRSFLQPRVSGVPWGAGAIGHAEWTGVPVRLVLERAGLRPETIEILFEGSDRGTEPDHPEPMQFARSLRLEKALHPDTLLATRMNGEPLEPAHGYPVRLFVPGWYGVSSVKWLRRVTAIDQPFRGYFQKKYTVQRPSGAGLTTAAVRQIAVKSEILRPHAGERLGLGMNRVFGIAWAGESAVAKVEVSCDGGRSWNQAELVGLQAPYSWTLWEYLWEVGAAGNYELLARATASDGTVQPREHDPLNGGYMIHHSRPVAVCVESVYQAPARLADADVLLYDMNAYAEANMRFPLDVNLEFEAGGGI